MPNMRPTNNTTSNFHEILKWSVAAAVGTTRPCPNAHTALASVLHADGTHLARQAASRHTEASIAPAGFSGKHPWE